MFVPLHYMENTNHLKLVVPNMHEFSKFWMFCKLHGILDNINTEKYDLPMQIKFLYLALFANFCHQSMHQVLQGTLKLDTLVSCTCTTTIDFPNTYLRVNSTNL